MGVEKEARDYEAGKDGFIIFPKPHQCHRQTFVRIVKLEPNWKCVVSFLIAVGFDYLGKIHPLQFRSLL